MMNSHRVIPKTDLCPAFFVIAAVSFAGVAHAADEIDFNRHIRPILSANCFQCHGPDKAAREAELRLDDQRSAKRVFASTPKKPSEFLKRITSRDLDEKMPPPSSKLKLTKAQIETLKRWVKQGAKYDRHWAFETIRPVTLPTVKNRKWPRNEIDRFVLARLERRGMSPSKQAGRETLIRRLSFDLTGLPPTLKEIDAFLADKSPQAYEKLVDRLLAKSSYGERMATAWMDISRYADSYGYQVDRDRFVWPWRDWVIKAFNTNMPYDKFITWQLAGDLLPNATDEQILATTFNRLHSQKVEGGSTPEEFRVEYVADRTQTFATAFLGLTMECARCHDHKFDPILQKEYYQFFAFFNNIDEAGLYSYFTQSVPTPTLRLTDAAMKKRIADVRRRIAQAEQKLSAIASARDAAFRIWSKSRSAKIPAPIAHLDFEKTGIGGNQRVAGRVGKCVKLTGDDAVGTKVGNFQRYQPFSVSLWMNTPKHFPRAVVFHRSRAWTDAGSRGYELLIEDGKLSVALIHFYPGNAIRVRTKSRIPLNRWQHVTVTYDGSSRADGLKIFVNGKPAELTVVRDKLRKNISGGGGNNITIGARFRDQGFTNGLIDEFRVFSRQLTPIEAAQLHDGRSLTRLVSGSIGKLSPSQRLALFRFYLHTADQPYRTQLAELQKVRAERSKLVDGLREIMVMRDRKPRRRTYLLVRGAYDKPGAPVEPGTPALFPAFPKNGPRNRLGLTKWLTDSRHPLTSRVAVNRLWQLLFGNGLVRTPEDFGSQGQPPTHPQLLDWLARDFIDHRWNMKRMLKLIVMSATYRQSSAIPNPKSEIRNPKSKDPENRYLSRAPSYRLPAEMLRDNALAVSGLLVRRIGGPPAKPYEVTVSFKPVGRDRGAGLYRRSLYTYWKRTAPAPVMLTLDASKREVCEVKREKTSSPLQALVLLNSPQFSEAARVTAQRLIRRHGDKTAAALSELFRLLTSRRPTAAEQKLLLDLYRAELAAFRKRPRKAVAYLKTGDAKRDLKIAAPKLAALAVVANTLLNYDGCVTKR